MCLRDCKRERKYVGERAFNRIVPASPFQNRDKIDSDEKRTKILTWFNPAAAAAGTKTGVEEDDEEEALQIACVHKEPIAVCSVHEKQSWVPDSIGSNPRGNC
jgi:hypothetical protein